MVKEKVKSPSSVKTTASRQKSKVKNKKTETKEVVPTPSTVDQPKISKITAKIPQTMEELLSMTGYQLRGVKKGDVIEGKITRVNPKEITVDIGSKAEGVVIDRELENYRDALLALKPGDKVVCQVIVAENDRGQSVVSLRRSIFENRWLELAQLVKSGNPIEVIVKDPVRGGVLVDYGGLRGYIPQSQIDATLMRQLEKTVGRKITVKVLEVDRQTNRLVFSQRAVSDQASMAKQKELLSLLTIGENVQAVISGVVPFGAFAKVKVNKDGEDHEIEGLIHISEIAWEKVDDPGQYLKSGESVKIKVIGVDVSTGKLTFSLKQLLPDPWENVLDMFAKDSTVKGKVSRVSPYGIFITLSPGIEGLIHISKVAPGEEPKVGDEISCTVEDVQPDKRKISLSMTLTEKPIGYR